MTRAAKPLPVFPTGVPNLDEVLGGGLQRGATVLVVGPPGAGKTILSQQICFHNATPTASALIFHTLSEPTAKTLRYLSQFEYFVPEKMNESIRYVDLGVILRKKGLADSLDLIMGHVKREKPAIVVIDSFKVFDELAGSREEGRKFIYELMVNLLAWECTTFLLGEYPDSEVMDSPLFSIADGIMRMDQREFAGYMARSIQVVKMRGAAHRREKHPLLISRAGAEVLRPRHLPGADFAPESSLTVRTETGVSRLDDLLGEGIPRGASVLVSGRSGTGKTVLMLDLLYSAAIKSGEKGLFFSYEETPAQLRAVAAATGLDLDAHLAKGLIEIVYTPQDEIRIDEEIDRIQRKVESFGPSRIALDSFSTLANKITEPQIVRDQMFRLTRMFREAGTVSFLTTNVETGSKRISRYGVEETITDGVIVLSQVESDLERQRCIEVQKLRNTAHRRGPHEMVIAHGGVQIYPRPLPKTNRTPQKATMTKKR